MNALDDKTKASYWRQLITNGITGVVVTLKDEQTIADVLQDQGMIASEGIDLKAKRTYHIKESDGICEWILVSLEHSEPLYVLVKIVDEETFDVRICFEPDDWEHGTRFDAIDNGAHWLFNEPNDPDDFIPSELEWNKGIEQEVDGVPIVYAVKAGLPLYGELQEYPDESNPLFAQVCEWQAEQAVANPELLIIEMGGLDEDDETVPDGGYLMFLQGENVSPNDVDLFIQ